MTVHEVGRATGRRWEEWEAFIAAKKAGFTPPTGHLRTRIAALLSEHHALAGCDCAGVGGLHGQTLHLADALIAGLIAGLKADYVLVSKGHTIRRTAATDWRSAAEMVQQLHDLGLLRKETEILPTRSWRPRTPKHRHVTEWIADIADD